MPGATADNGDYPCLGQRPPQFFFGGVPSYVSQPLKAVAANTKKGLFFFVPFLAPIWVRIKSVSQLVKSPCS